MNNSSSTKKYILNEFNSIGEFRLFILLASAIFYFLKVLVSYCSIFNYVEELRNKSNKDKSKNPELSKDEYEIQNKLRNILKDNEVSIYVIKDNKSNAFNVGTKDLFYTSGLRSLLSDEELIGVLLHEYGHYVKRHSQKTIFYYNSVFFIRFNFLFNIIYSLGISDAFTKFMLHVIGFIITNIPIEFVQSFISKRGEYFADSYAKRCGYGSQLKSALLKLELKYRQIYCKKLTSEQCDLLFNTPDAFSSHPTVQQRTAKLLFSLTLLPVRKLFGFANKISDKYFVKNL